MQRREKLVHSNGDTYIDKWLIKNIEFGDQIQRSYWSGGFSNHRWLGHQVDIGSASRFRASEPRGNDREGDGGVELRGIDRNLKRQTPIVPALNALFR